MVSQEKEKGREKEERQWLSGESTGHFILQV
jgi:hypothetical protein